MSSFFEIAAAAPTGGDNAFMVKPNGGEIYFTVDLGEATYVWSPGARTPGGTSRVVYTNSR